jgi:hypothetical protein
MRVRWNNSIPEKALISGALLSIVLIVCSFFLPWVLSGVPEYSALIRTSRRVWPSPFSTSPALEGPNLIGMEDEAGWWGFPVPPGWVLLIAALVLVVAVISLLRRPESSVFRRSSLAIAIAGLAVLGSSVASMRQTDWLNQNYFGNGRFPDLITQGLGVKFALAAGVVMLLVSVVPPVLLFASGLSGQRRKKFVPLSEAQLKMINGGTSVTEASDSVLQNAGSKDAIDIDDLRKDSIGSSNRALIVNSLLFLAVALLGLLPLFTLRALGMSESLNAFKVDEGDDQRFWLTVIPVGWLVVAISVVAFGVIALASRKSSRPSKRIENHVLASYGLIIGAVLIASWYYANKQIEDATGAAMQELVAEGNPFAALGGAMVGGISFTPAVGFWLMLAVALAIVGYNLFLVRAMKASQVSSGSIPDSSLASGIRELSELKDQGLISDDEFNLAKRKILGIGETS